MYFVVPVPHPRKQLAAGRAAKRMLCPAKILVGMPGCFVGDTEVLIYPAASDSTVIAGLQVSPEHASAHANALWGSVCLVAGLGIATALVDDQRRRREAREQQEALDALFGGTDLLDDVEDDGEEPEPGTPPRNIVASSNLDKPFHRHNHLSHAAFKTGCDRVFSQGDGEWMDRNASAAECIDPMGGSFPTNENDQDHPLWHKTCKAKSSPSPSRKATVAAVDIACPKATIRGVPSCASVRTMVHTPSVRKRNLPAAQTRRGWLWAAVAGLLVLLGGGLLFRQASESSAPAPFTAVSASPASHSAPADATPKYATKQIRDFCGFEWVLARNPEVADEERSEFEEVDYRQWRWVELELTKPDGDLLKVGLGRPIAWLVVNDITPGATTWLDLPEMGAVGYATVVSVVPCPDPGPKPHPDCRLVTGVFRHSSTDCVNVHVAGLASPIGTTRNHRFWSEDRQAFVEAGDLHPGETLLTADGTPTSVLSIAPRPGIEPVYNLEVDVEHVYYVAADGVLVHNTYGSVAFGNKIHAKFTQHLRQLTGQRWLIDRTRPGLRGVDITFYQTIRRVRDVRGNVSRGFRHAELKPYSTSGFNTFLSQLDRWRTTGLRGNVGLFMYDAQGAIFFVGVY